MLKTSSQETDVEVMTTIGQDEKKSIKKTKHTELKEEIRSLSQMNSNAKSLSGVRGVVIKQASFLSSMFQWDASQVFVIYEADSNGKQLNENAEPILFAVQRLTGNLDNFCDEFGLIQVAITTQLDKEKSNQPHIFLSQKRKWCGYNSCDIQINDQGNSTKLGTIQQGYRGKLVLSDNDYVEDLTISHTFCQCAFNSLTYDIEDKKGNKGLLIRKTECCSFSYPVHYNVGFPANYTDDQNNLLLCQVIFLAFVNFEKKSKKHDK